MADGFDAFADSEELPPSLPALDVERGALACVLCDEGEVHRAFVRMAPRLAPETFGNPLHGVIWRAFALVHARGDGLDPVMVGEALLAARQPKAKVLLTELVRTSVAPARCEAYAQRLAEHALRRATRAQLVEALARVDGEGAPLDVVSDVRGILAAIPADVQGAYDDSLHAAVVETLAEIEASMAACQNHQNTCARWGVPTLDGGWYNGGWNDGALGGLFRSKLYVLGGVPASGKTTLAWQAALATATDEHLTDRRVLVFSLEMSRTDLVKRLAGQKAGVPEMVIERGALSGDQWEKLKTAMQELARLPIAIIGRCRTVESIRARVLAECAAGGVGLVVVDFLQLAKTAQRTRDKNEADEERIYALKHLANEARVPMLAITAMTKMAQAKVAKESDAASSTDAKGAGSEYAADVLAFLVRTNPRDTRAEVDVQFAMTKRRGGQEGDVLLEFDRSRGRFRPHPSASGSQFTDEGTHDDL